MELQEILSALEYLGDGTFPRQALEQAVARREETTPLLLANLEKDIGRIATFVKEERTYMAHLYAMFLLAQFREPRAYPLIVEFFSQPGAASHECTGDLVTEALPKILASIAAGDWKPMTAMFENRKLDVWVRGAALQGMTILALDGELERDAMISYLRQRFAGGLDPEDDVMAWTALVDACVDLHTTELYSEIRQAYEEGRIDTLHITMQDVGETFARPRESYFAELRRRGHYVKVNDAIKEMECWSCFNESPFRKKYRSGGFFMPESAPAAPMPSIQTEVGRNDPCPCGSGKKWKKCCGSATKRQGT